MTEDHLREALLEIESSLNLVEAARQTLIPVLECVGAGTAANTIECILCTLETAYNDGQAGLDVVRKAVSEKAA